MTWIPRRLIPAHAGKTGTRSLQSQGKRAHPRSRGENGFCTKPTTERNGSSPLTRGKPLSRRNPAPTCRLIPAHAGKTRARRYRAGGGGSSPLTRGKRPDSPVLAAHGRLIPAHAGKTCGGPAPMTGPPAHPRSRGENPTPRHFSRKRQGSSPLTRGKRSSFRVSEEAFRLIPAHAGKTRRFVRHVRECSAHPRSRGENAKAPD